MSNEELLKVLADLISEGAPEIPNIEEIRILAKASEITREEKERNKELNIINAKIRGRASTGYFDLGEWVFIGYSDNIDALEAAGYTLTFSDIHPYHYEISWRAEVADEGTTEPGGSVDEPSVDIELPED